MKDFRGLNPNGFDKAGNYNFGFTEQTVFPEVDAAAVTFQQGMNITMVTTARNAGRGPRAAEAVRLPVPRRAKKKNASAVAVQRMQPQQLATATENYGNQSLGSKTEAARSAGEEIRRRPPAAQEGKELRGAGQAAARLQPDAHRTTAASSPAAAAAYLRKFKVCRIMLRELALAGKIPGLKKASW